MFPFVQSIRYVWAVVRSAAVGCTVAGPLTALGAKPGDLDFTLQSLGATPGMMRSGLYFQKLNLKTNTKSKAGEEYWG